MAVCGKWELVFSDDNFEAYMTAVGVSEEMRQKAKVALTQNSKLVQEISHEGDVWKIRTITKEGEKILTATLGKPTPWATLDGRNINVTFSLEGDSLVELQEGNGFQSRNVRTVAGDEMTMTMTSGSVTCVRKYKKV